MRYFKRYWDESRGDEHDNWGCSWWYFEADEAGVVTRQIEVFDNGPMLRYDQCRRYDEFGGLSDKSLDLDEFTCFAISQVEFEQVWGNGG